MPAAIEIAARWIGYSVMAVGTVAVLSHLGCMAIEYIGKRLNFYIVFLQWGIDRSQRKRMEREAKERKSAQAEGR